MKPFVRSLVVPLLCLLALSACGSQSSDAQLDGPGTAAPSTTSSTPQNAIGSVTLARGGGLKPSPLTRVFATDQAPPKGFTEADVQQVLAKAQAFVSAGGKLTPLGASDACCDRYYYTITITWADGTMKSYDTVEGAPQPKPFVALMDAMA